MSTYKLTYFNTRGRAEISRFIFAQAGVAYEDNRVAGEDWVKFKPSTPYGSLPVLEVDGKMLASSGVIARFLAERFGLAGSNDFENAEIASIVDTVGDLFLKLLRQFLEKDEAKKEELKKEMGEEVFPKFLGIFENLINTNGAPEGWIYGSKVTYADFTLYSLFETLKSSVPNLFDKYPGIQKNLESVSKLPNIAKWLSERPKSDY